MSPMRPHTITHYAMEVENASPFLSLENPDVPFFDDEAYEVADEEEEQEIYFVNMVFDDNEEDDWGDLEDDEGEKKPAAKYTLSSAADWDSMSEEDDGKPKAKTENKMIDDGKTGTETQNYVWQHNRY